MAIPNTTHRILVEKLGGSDPSTFIGNEGEVFYDPDAGSPTLRLSDGSTPGGVVVGGSGGGGNPFDQNVNTDNDVIFNTVTLTNGAIIKDNSGDSISFGQGAGEQNQGHSAVALGEGAGYNTQGAQAIALGRGSGNYLQGQGAIGIGFCAGATEQGNYSIALGFKAGRGNMDNDGTPNQPANSIIINASSTALNGINTGLYINPIREDVGNTTKAVYYDTTTKELTYANPTGGGSGDSLLSDNTDITVTINNAETPGTTRLWEFKTNGSVNFDNLGTIGVSTENPGTLVLKPDAELQQVGMYSFTENCGIDVDENAVLIFAGGYNSGVEHTFYAERFNVGTRFNTVAQVVPSTSKGAAGDQVGDVIIKDGYVYYCTANYSNGVADIWKRIQLPADTW